MGPGDSSISLTGPPRYGADNPTATANAGWREAKALAEKTDEKPPLMTVPQVKTTEKPSKDFDWVGVGVPVVLGGLQVLASALGGRRLRIKKPRFQSEPMTLPKVEQNRAAAARGEIRPCSEGNSAGGKPPADWTRDTWLAPEHKPITLHTERCWVDVYVNKKTGEFFEHDLTDTVTDLNTVLTQKGKWKKQFTIVSRPRLPDGATPDTFVVSAIPDFYKEQSIKTSPGTWNSHAEIVQNLALDGVQDRLAVLGIDLGHDFDLEDLDLAFDLENLKYKEKWLLRYLKDLKEDKNHSWAPYFTHLNCSFETPYSSDMKTWSKQSFPKELVDFAEEERSKLRRELAKLGVNITQGAGNDDSRIMALQQCVQHPHIKIVGGLNPNQFPWRRSSETPLVTTHAQSVYPFTVAEHSWASPYRKGYSEEELKALIPDPVKHLHGAKFSDLNPESFIKHSDGFIYLKLDSARQIPEKVYPETGIERYKARSVIKEEIKENNNQWWLDFLNQNPSLNCERPHHAFVLNNDGTLNYVLKDYTFSGTSFAAPLTQNAQLREKFGHPPPAYPVVTDSEENKQLYKLWVKHNIPEEFQTGFQAVEEK